MSNQVSKQEHNLDLSGIPCPMNYVKTRLYLDKIPAGSVLNVTLDQGEPVDSVSKSIQKDGYELLDRKETKENRFILTILKSALCLAAACLFLSASPSKAQEQNKTPQVSNTTGNTVSQSKQKVAPQYSAMSINQLRTIVNTSPKDLKARFHLAEVLKTSGRTEEALSEYEKCIEQDPSFYLAAHQIAALSNNAEQLENVINHLNKLKQEKPKELMLRVALSELEEKRGNYYLSARVLIDLVYQNAVPQKYQNKVNARIHYLLVKAKDKQRKEEGQEAEDDLAQEPVPLPESTLNSDHRESKAKDNKMTQGFGHAPLMP
jgi:TusA-related sulfurtransferase